ncbi:MAG: thioredoxin [Opitutaceae bacterium]|nr:thioredoxin [Cytophagales bacterium]
MRITLCIVSYVLLAACSNAGSQNVLSPSKFEQSLKDQPGIIVDVRTPGEYAEGHISNALNIDFYSPEFNSGFKKFDKAKPIYVYCQRGGRSESAVEKLNKNGFKNVYELDGGIIKWEEEGKKVEGKSSVLPPAGITSEDYSKLISSQKLVLVDFSATWCGPCRKLSPLLEKVGHQRPNDVKVVMIDVDSNEQIARQIGIEELPTLIWYKNGKLELRMIGFHSEKDINETIDRLLK